MEEDRQIHKDIQTMIELIDSGRFAEVMKG
jgi:hypothetical protein